MIGLRFTRRHRDARNIAVSPWTNASTDYHRSPFGAELVPNLLEDPDRAPVRVDEFVGAVADFPSPVEAGPPRGTLEHETSPQACRDLRIRAEVLPKRGFAVRCLQQVKRGEFRQLPPFLEDQGCFDAAVRQEQAAVELGERLAIAGHGRLLCGSRGSPILVFCRGSGGSG